MESGQHSENGQADAALAVTISGLTKAFDGVVVLKDVSLQINAGEVHGLIGANGSGKSTLIKVLSGFHKYDGLDELTVGGRVEKNPDFRAIAAQRFAFVHQDRCLVPNLTIAENCALTMGTPTGRLGQIDHRKEVARVKKVLGSVGIVADPNAALSTLGPAEGTLLAIGRAVSSVEPGAGSLLVLDEPTTALPESEVEVVLKTIRQIAGMGIGVLFVSHRLNEILESCDVVTVLKDGRVVGSRIPTAGTTADTLVELMLGRSLVKESHRREAPTGADPVLSVQDLNGPRISGISFDVRPGEVIGITGLVGCGKSELGRLIAGQQERMGLISIDGAEVRGNNPLAAVSHGISYVPSERLTTGSLPEMTAAENLTLPDLKSFTSVGRILGRREKSETASWMHETGTVPARPLQIFRNFSGGNQQKIVLSKWLRLKPKILVIDEPTQGVDVGAKEDVYRLIREAADRGTGIIVISSEPEEVARVASRVLVIDRGTVAADLRTNEISSDSVSEAIFTGRQLAS